MPKPLETERLVVAWGPEGREWGGTAHGLTQQEGGLRFAASLLCVSPHPHQLWGPGGLPSERGCGLTTPSCHPSSFSPRELQARVGHGGDRCRCATALPVALCWRAPAGRLLQAPQPGPGSRVSAGLHRPRAPSERPWTFPPLLAGTPRLLPNQLLMRPCSMEGGGADPRGAPQAAVSSLAGAARAWTRWASS